LPSRGQGGRPVDPGYGQGGGQYPWHKPEVEWPPGPTDPDWGVDSGEHPDHPIYIEDPAKPDQGLPPVGDHKPPTTLPPGSIWPPLPEGAPTGKHAFLVWITGIGYRYGVFEIPASPTHPDQGTKPTPGTPTQPISQTKA
jgi:hypothetical protein